LQPDGTIKVEKAEGMVRNLRAKFEPGSRPGRQAVAHTRYGTAGSSLLANAHPFLGDNDRLAVVHNGEIINAARLRQEFESQGVSFSATSDTELLPKMLERTQENGVVGRILTVLNQIPGAYALVILWNGYLIGASDPYGTHPLWLGRFPNGGHIFASEDAAIRTVGAEPIKYLKAGQVIVISPEQEITTYWLNLKPADHAHCSFNYDYTARPDSNLWGRSVTSVRDALGIVTFNELVAAGLMPQIDVIVPVLDSGRTHTLTFSKACARHRLIRLIQNNSLETIIETIKQIDLDTLFPFRFGINRAHDAGRNFQIPVQGEREKHIMIKHSGDPAVVKGKRLLVGDDSVVRATTAKAIIKMLRDLGATEVHWVSFSPPLIASCPYGGTETKDESLLAAVRFSSIEEIRRFIGANSLNYLSIEGYRRVINAHGSGNHCMACMDKVFPIPLDQ